jgi:ferredoxin
MGRKLQVTVDKVTCVSNQACITTAPGVFQLDAERKSEVADLSAASEADIIDAAMNCPVGAISVVDAETGEDLLE